MSDEEKKAIEYLKVRLYGNQGCKFIDIAQSDLKIFINLVDNLQKDIGNWKKYSNEQDDTITLNNNKICDLEFKVEKQQKEIGKEKERNEELKDDNKKKSIVIIEYQDLYEKLVDKIKAKIEECEKEKNIPHEMDFKAFYRIKDLKNIEIKVLQSLLDKE